VQQVDLTSSDFLDQEIIPFDIELLELFSRKELLLNRDMLYKFQPKPISQFNASPFGIGMPYGDKGEPRIIIKADTTAYALKFPALETMEGKLEKALGIEFLASPDEALEDLEDEDDRV